MRILDTPSKFKKTIRSSISMPIPRHHSYGLRKLNIILTHIRCNASFLNCDWCKAKMLSNASCNCGAPCEISHHFLFDCEKYTDSREILFPYFHMVRHSYRKHLIKLLLYINRNSGRMYCSEAMLELYLVF